MVKSKTPLYRRWLTMKVRCKYKSHRAYRWYGARGITICKRWMVFDNFAADMGPIPFKEATLDRINSDGHYEPGNVRWSTMLEQARNRRGNRVLMLRGKSKCVSQWAEELGLPISTIMGRKRMGWSDRKTLTAPLRASPLFSYSGKSQTLKQWAVETGVPSGTLWIRLKHGWSIKRTFSTGLHTQGSHHP